MAVDGNASTRPQLSTAVIFAASCGSRVGGLGVHSPREIRCQVGRHHHPRDALVSSTTGTSWTPCSMSRSTVAWIDTVRIPTSRLSSPTTATEQVPSASIDAAASFAGVSAETVVAGGVIRPPGNISAWLPVTHTYQRAWCSSEPSVGHHRQSGIRHHLLRPATPVICREKTTAVCRLSALSLTPIYMG